MHIYKNFVFYYSTKKGFSQKEVKPNGASVINIQISYKAHGAKVITPLKWSSGPVCEMEWTGRSTQDTSIEKQ